MATAAFNARWLSAERGDVAILVKVELTDPTPLTLYLSHRDFVLLETTLAGVKRGWEAALDDIGPIVHNGSLGALDPALATFDFHIAPKRLASQAAAAQAPDLFFGYHWRGAAVTVYQWPLGLDQFLTNGHQIFSGVVIDYQTENIGVRVYCQQDNSWIRRVPDIEVTRAKFPRASEKSIGLPVPVCYGDLRDDPARPPATDFDTFRQAFTSIAGMTRAGVRGVTTRIGTGGAGQKGEVLFASHACKLFNDDANGSTPAIELSNRLSEIDPDGALVLNAAGGTGFDFIDITSAGVQPFNVFYPVMPIDSSQPAATPGENPRAATDVWNDSSYAVLDYNNNKREIRFPLPDVPPQGLALLVKFAMAYLTSAGATHLRVELNDGAIATGTTTIAASTARTGAGGTLSGVGGSPVGNGWEFGTYGTFLRVYFTGVATGETAKIFGVGLAIQCRPQWPVVTPARVIRVPDRYDYRWVHKIWGGASRHWYTVYKDELVPERDRVDAVFFATLKGYADSGGAFTGTGTDLIERPCDVINHFLQTYCGVASASVETGGGVNGSFVDARAQLVTWRGSDMKVALAIDEFTDTAAVLRNLCAGGFGWAFISRLTGKWKFIPWHTGLTTNAPRKLSRWDLMDQSGPKLIPHRDDVLNDLTVRFGYDAYQRSTVHETFVGPARSSSGYFFRKLRDETVDVVASESDRLDFSDGTNRTVNLTPGTYTPIGFAQHLAGLVAAVTTNGVCQIAWGFQVVAGYNDKLDFNDGAARTATLNAGVYTGTTMPVEVARAMNAVSSSWTCTYSVTTRKFTIDRTAGTKLAKFASGANVAKTCAPMIGYDIADVAFSRTSDIEVEPERYVFALKTTAPTLRWENGANGIDAATPRACGMLLGFDMARDSSPIGSVALLAGDSPKNSREADCALSVARYGKRPGLTVDLRAVADTATAREVRNRQLDWHIAPPVEIQFQAERCHDFDLGDVFEFDATMDEIQGFLVPDTNGSWVGKRFIVTSIVQHCMPTVHQEITAFYDPES
jgi:hypothetical protein